MIAEIVDSNEAVNYVYGDDLISQKRGPDTSVYLYDGLGSTRALSDATGSVTDTYDYAALGELLNQTGTTENDYLYTGEQFDAGMDQYYLRARYYNQDIGRFPSMDTWMGVNSDPQTLHKYLYTHADPVNNIDPTGNFTLGSLSRAQSIQAELGLAQADFGFSLFDAVLTGDTPSTQARLLGLAALGGPAAFKLLSKFSSRFRKACNSFDGETLVSSEDGLKLIKEIKIGDQVWAYNEETGERSLQEVVHLIHGDGEKQLVEITLTNGEIIKTTDEHPFFVEGKWINAIDLTEGVQLLNLNGSLVHVDSVNHYNTRRKVYNLTVNTDHTYYVGQSEVLTHNTSACRPLTSIRVDHIIRGGINGRGKATGWHSRHGGYNPVGRRIVGSPGPKDRNGLYEAVIEIRNSNGKWIRKRPTNTFFPDNWSPNKILSEIKGAYTRAVGTGAAKADGRWEAFSPSGVFIRGRIDVDGRVMQAFPVYGRWT